MAAICCRRSGAMFTSPLSTVLAITAVGLALTLIVPRWRGRSRPTARGTLLVGLAAYALTRMLFFLVLNPWEALLFASSVTVPHLMLIAAPFAASGSLRGGDPADPLGSAARLERALHHRLTWRDHIKACCRT